MQDTLTHAPIAASGVVIQMPLANPLAVMVRPEPLHLVFPATFGPRGNDTGAVLAEIDDLLIL